MMEISFRPDVFRSVGYGLFIEIQHMVPIVEFRERSAFGIVYCVHLSKFLIRVNELVKVLSPVPDGLLDNFCFHRKILGYRAAELVDKSL